MATSTTVLEVDRAVTTTTAIVRDAVGDLAEGSVRLRVDRFAITANTITYAQIGALLGYWDFFPTSDPAWGRVPAMGWADVVESAHPEVPTGMRCYGWYPMATFVDVAVAATSEGLRDDSPHRQQHAPVYRAFVDQRRDPNGPRSSDPEVLAEDPEVLADLEDRHALLRGLFLTGYLADAWFADADYFGAEAAVVLSASSKTGIAFAHEAAGRGLDALVGVTSEGNVELVDSLGLYTDVITYDQVGSLPARPTVAVDVAGDGPTTAALHAHLGDRLAHSMSIGRSHSGAPTAPVTAGPTPELFFAPTALGQLADRDAVLAGAAPALERFVDGSRAWLRVERAEGPHATQETWAEVHAGAVPPSVGRVASMHEPSDG